MPPIVTKIKRSGRYLFLQADIANHRPGCGFFPFSQTHCILYILRMRYLWSNYIYSVYFCIFTVRKMNKGDSRICRMPEKLHYEIHQKVQFSEASIIRYSLGNPMMEILNLYIFGVIYHSLHNEIFTGAGCLAFCAKWVSEKSFVLSEFFSFFL